VNRITIVCTYRVVDAYAVVHLRSERNAVPAELLAHASPLMWEHIGFSGDFLWNRAAATAGP
jgi:hypothetical protein